MDARMNTADAVYSVKTGKGFEEAVVSVLKSIEKKGWTIFSIYDLKERLAAKGFEHGWLKIIEICSAKHADRLLKKNKLVSLCMPCKVNVIEEPDGVVLAGMRPTIVSQFFPEIPAQEALEVDADIREIIDNAR